MNEAQEISQGTTAINAAVKAGIKHIIFSSLPSGQLIAGVHVPHFCGKWKISQHLSEVAKKNGVAHTHFFVPYYFENLAGAWGPKPDATTGKVPFSYGMGGRGLAVYSVEDTGGPIVTIFKAPTSYFDGKLVDFFGEVITVAAIAETFTRVTTRPAIAADLPAADWAKLPYANAEFAAMWALDTAIDDLRSASKANPRDPYTAKLGLKASDYVIGRALYPQAKTFEDWLHASKWLAK